MKLEHGLLSSLSLNLSQVAVRGPEWPAPARAEPGEAVPDGGQAVQQAMRAARIGVLDVCLPSGQGYFSPGCLDVLGYSEEDAGAFLSGWVPLVHPQDVPTYRDNRRRAFGGEIHRFEEEVRRMRRDGSYGWVRTVGEVAQRDAQGVATRLVAVLEDVDARHRTEAALRTARRRLQALSAHAEAQMEAERKHLAAEVHDQCGQVLTLLKMELAALRPAAGQEPALAEGMRRLDAMVDELVQMSRDIITRLRPPVLDLGLVPALEWLAGRWTGQTGMHCELACALDDLPLPDDHAATLFRLVQESLTNAARHAQASAVHVSLEVQEGCLHLRVADDGCGFDTGADHVGHFGLLGMRERAERLGAQLELLSRPGAGTQVCLRMPLPAVPGPSGVAPGDGRA